MKTNNSTTSKTSPQVIAFGPDETERARELISEFDRLEGHRISLRRDGLAARIEATELAYRSHPTDENFADYKAAIMADQMFSLQPRASTSVELVLERFTESQVVPFLQSFLEPALTQARKTLEVVTEEEKAKHLQEFGYELEKSKAVDSAAAPVQRLERMLALIRPAAGSANPRALRTLLSDLIAPVKTN